MPSDPIDVTTPGGFDVSGIVQLLLGSSLLLMWATGMFAPDGQLANIVVLVIVGALYGGPAYQLAKGMAK
jgi:hypothetical protein